MQKKLDELLTMVHKVKLFRAGPDHTYWIEFSDEYEKRTLCDEDFGSLIDRAHSLATISRRSFLRSEKQTA